MSRHDNKVCGHASMKNWFSNGKQIWEILKPTFNLRTASKNKVSKMLVNIRASLNKQNLIFFIFFENISVFQICHHAY